MSLRLSIAKSPRELGLPVRRVPGARSWVSTDSASLDAWKPQLAYVVNREDRCYRWPLGHGIAVEVRCSGADLSPAHFARVSGAIQGGTALS